MDVVVVEVAQYATWKELSFFNSNIARIITVPLQPCQPSSETCVRTNYLRKKEIISSPRLSLKPFTQATSFYLAVIYARHPIIQSQSTVMFVLQSFKSIASKSTANVRIWMFKVTCTKWDRIKKICNSIWNPINLHLQSNQIPKQYLPLIHFYLAV